MASHSFHNGITTFPTGSVTVQLFTYDGDDFVGLYGNSITNSPSSELFRFQNPPEDLGTDNRFRFTTDGDVSLSASTTYWLVFGTTSDDYQFGATDSDSEMGVWDIGGFRDWHSTDEGATWTSRLSNHARFIIEATIVPETSTYAIVGGMCLIAFVAFRRIRIAKSSK